MRSAVLRTTLSSIFFAVLTCTSANAEHLLEIEQPKVEAGEIEIEYRGDYHFQQPRRRFIQSPELVFDDNGHTIGIGYGLTKWLGLLVGLEA